MFIMNSPRLKKDTVKMQPRLNSKKKLNVMHVLGSFDTGGAEMGVVRLSNYISGHHKFVRQYVCSITDKTGMKEYLDPRIKFISLGLKGRSYSAFYRLFRIFRKEKLNIVHVNNLAPWADVLLASWLCGCLCVETFHGLEKACIHYSKLRKFFLKWVLAKSSAVTAVSTEAKELFSKTTGIDSRIVRVIENGIDTDKFSPFFSRDEKNRARKKMGLEKDDLLFVCVAGFRPVKNHIGLVRAFKKALCSGSSKSLKLILVGDGNEETAVKNEVKKAGLEANVLFWGNREDVNILLKVMDAFVLNSYTEGMSYSILEAMASGLPVFATSVGSNNKLIRNREEGYIYRPGDEDALAKIMVKASREPESLTNMGAKGRSMVLSRYSLHRMAEDYKKLYLDISYRNGKICTR